MGKVKDGTEKKRDKAKKKEFPVKDKITKKKKVQETKGDEEEKLTLDLIKELGGDQEDFNFLEQMDAESQPKELKESDHMELKNLIKSLNLSKYNVDSIIIKDEEEDIKEEDEETGIKETKKDENAKLKKDKSDKKEKKSGESIQENEVSSTTANDVVDSDEEVQQKPEYHFVKTYSTRTYCLLKNEDKWYSTLNTGPVDSSSPNLAYWLPKIRKYTEKVWELELQNFEHAQKSAANKSESAWMSQVMRSGTLTDKLSAYVVQIQQSPIHSFSVLETLLSFISLKSRRPCLLALETLTALLISDLLIPDRNLKSFDRNPFDKLQELTGGNKDTRDRYLITWMFEDKLRDFYIKFIQAMDEIGKDTIENTRAKVISCTQKLLCGNPEQEQMLMERLVNRLGDPIRKVAAKTMHHLGLLLEEHPGMKGIVVTEVERLLYRPNVSPKAQYYGICFLSQLMLEKRGGGDLAAKLVKIYFSFFRMSIKKGEVDTKLMSALLTGVNRAFPYASLDPKQLDEQLEIMHKLVHMVSFNISIQALTLLYQILDSRDSVNDRFFTALYRKVLDPAFATSSKQVMFLNLLYNSIRKDASVQRVRGFIKRLLQSCLFLPSNSTAGILYIISQITRNRKDLGELSIVVEPGAVGNDMSKFDESDDEEHYQDAKEEDDDINDENDDVKKQKVGVKKEDKSAAGWVFKSKSKVHEEKAAYDPLCRNPLYAGAEKSSLWELDVLTDHFHPTVQLFAKNLSTNVPTKYQGDPLNDFTVPKFLDRFVFRNPKKDPAKNKPSTVLGKRNIYRPSGIKSLAPDSKEFLSREESSIPGDELFLYKYFQAKAERKASKADEDDADSVTSEDFNDFLDQMGGKAKDFDDEDIDFAGGMREGGEDDAEDMDDEDQGEVDSDEDEAGDSDGEPDGLDGESNEGFKDLSDSEGEGDKEDEDDDMTYLQEEDDEEMDEEDLDFSNDDDDDFEEKKPSGSKKQKSSDMFGTQKKSKKKMKFDPSDLSSLLADADQFSHLLEENQDAGTSQSYSTKDKASVKQLKWEKRQENFLKGNNWKQKKGGGAGGKKGANWGNKKQNQHNKGKPPNKKKFKR